MNSDDIIYLSLLGFSIAFGYIFRLLGDIKQWTSTIFGIIITLFVSGYHILHPICSIIITLCILKGISRRHVHKVSFFCLFSYLFFFRLCHYVGFPMAPAHANAIQMILTLKLVGLCFEVHDAWRKREELKMVKMEEEKDKLKLQLKYEDLDPTPLDIFHYSFCYIGILTGPYYKYRVYHDMLVAKETPGLDCVQAMLKRIRYVPIYAVLFLISGYYFPLSFAESTEIFRDYSVLYRIWYMTPVFFNFRMRIYSGFVLAECGCIMAGLGAYPTQAKNRPGRGPVDYEALEENKKNTQTYDFETIHNIDEYGSDFSPTVRGGMKCWNMTVQYWLACNVYRRLIVAKPLKEAITMLVSAFWHGVYSGYYLSLLTVPFILAVEDFYEKLIRRKLSERSQKFYDFITWFMKMQHFAYMGMAFLLLRVDTTIHYWRSVGFIYHGIIVIMHAIAQYVNLIRGKVEKKLERARDTARVGDTNIKFQRVKSTESGDGEDSKKEK